MSDNNDFSVDLDIESLRNAYSSLVKAFNIFSAGDDNKDICDIYADSCIKRFEYTYETAWKTMKKYFKLQYNKREEELTMNNIFRYMESYGFAESWLRWKEYNTQKITQLLNIIFKKQEDWFKLYRSFCKMLNSYWINGILYD